MRFWLLCLVMLALLTACGGDDDPAATPVPNTPSADLTPTQEDNGTPESNPFAPGQVMQPGVIVQDGLEVLSSRTYSRETGVGWIVLVVKNSTPDPIGNIVVLASLLDSQNRERDTLRAVSPFQNIPPGLEVPMVLTFSTPPDYSDFSALVQVDRDVRVGQWQGFYDLPVTLDPLPSGDFPLSVTGRIGNSSDKNLLGAAVVVGAYDAEGQILGAAFATLTGLSATGEWATGGELIWSATFSYLPASIAEVRVVGAGYQATGQ
jgi:hypothetical protein